MLQVPISWPASRDQVWKANIPHTHLAEEKSDQRWMVVNGDKINFPGGGTHFHAGADKYIIHIAQVLDDLRWCKVYSFFVLGLLFPFCNLTLNASLFLSFVPI